MSRLFIVPWPCAGILSGAKPASAASTVSAMRLEVSTFPATTAEGRDARRPGSPRGLYGERGVGAGVGENVLGEQHAQGEVACRAGDGEGAVYVAATASAVPEKSILIESPSTVTVALMVMSSSVMPSPSMQSSAECSPSGRSRWPRGCARRRRSPSGGEEVFAAAFHQLPDAFFGDVVRAIWARRSPRLRQGCGRWRGANRAHRRRTRRPAPGGPAG